MKKNKTKNGQRSTPHRQITGSGEQRGWQRYIGRLDVVLLVVFLLFLVLLVRLAEIQIVNGDVYEALVTKTETNITKQSVPRGIITDRNGTPLVSNEGVAAIAYTRGPNVSGADIAETAAALSQYVSVSTDSLKQRDLKDYWLATHQEEVKQRLTAQEKQLEGSELNEAQLAKVTEADIQFTDAEKQAAAIFKKMNGAYAFAPTFIKNDDVSPAEVAAVSEHLSELPGVETTMDWNRTYPAGDLLKSVLGGVTSEQRGLPEEHAATYLSKGYARNDRVGNAYLEQQLDADLRGAKARYETEINQSGEVSETGQTFAGAQGNTVQLTIDADLQQKIQDIADEYLKERTIAENNTIYVTVSDPKTGEILSLVGRRKNADGSISEEGIGNFSSSFVIGSAVKGATVAAGYHYGVLSPEHRTYIDQPADFAGTPRITSWWGSEDPNRRELDDVKALALSSNIYMVRVAMAIGGLPDYHPGISLANLDPTTAMKLRYIYQQFGLGASTGLGLPNEAEGIAGEIQSPGNAIALSFGQFDTFTPLQLNQYVATIANNGVRMRLHLIDRITKPQAADENKDLEQLVYQEAPTVLNRVQVDDAAIQRIQQGFWTAANAEYGLSYRLFHDIPGQAATKTGTAEIRDGVTNSTFVGYAPYKDPEIAVSVVIPNIHYMVQPSSAQAVAQKIFQAYFGVAEEADENDSHQPNSDNNNDNTEADAEATAETQTED